MELNKFQIWSKESLTLVILVLFGCLFYGTNFRAFDEGMVNEIFIWKIEKIK